MNEKADEESLCPADNVGKRVPVLCNHSGGYCALARPIRVRCGGVWMKAKFTIPGNPTGKGRPRFRAFKQPFTDKIITQTYTDKKTAEYEECIRAEYRKQCRGIKFQDGEILDMRIVAYYAIPKSESQAVKTAKEAGVIRPTKTPDCDNVLKAVADALNKLAYKDDSQIVDCQVRKYYSHQPRVEVTILPAKKERKEL